MPLFVVPSLGAESFRPGAVNSGGTGVAVGSIDCAVAVGGAEVGVAGGTAGVAVGKTLTVGTAGSPDGGTFSFVVLPAVG